MAVRKDINYVQNMLVGVLLKNVNGLPISVVSCYSAIFLEKKKCERI
jgi:hypothetical protein